MPLQREQDLHRAQPSRVGHSVQDTESGGRVPRIDGVGQLVAGHRPGFAQVGLQIGHRDARSGAVGGGQGPQQTLHPAEILPHVLAEELGRLRLELDRRAA